MRGSVTFPFHSPPNEPKEVLLQNSHILVEDDCKTLVVIDWTCHSPINFENGEGLKNARTPLFKLTQWWLREFFFYFERTSSIAYVRHLHRKNNNFNGRCGTPKGVFKIIIFLAFTYTIDNNL